MPRIFISYRREDSQHQADRLHAALKRAVHDPARNIFIDIDNIPVGVDFAAHLESKVAQCDVLLALIGPGWLSSRDAKTGERRLDDPGDFVRIEIASALRRGVVVAPVLLDGAQIPAAEDLPDDLKPLVRRNASEVRRQTFDADTKRMIHGLQLKKVRRAEKPSTGGWIAAGVLTAIALVAVAGVSLWTLDPFHWRPSVQQARADPAPTSPAAPPVSPSPAPVVAPFSLTDAAMPVDCTLCPAMMALPGGAYLRGSPDGMGDADEHPQKQVTIRPFAMARYEVTWEEYGLCVKEGGCAPAKDDGFGGGARPVTNVMWSQASAYAGWLSRYTGHAYRLPSEAEWEYAERAGSVTTYPWGENPDLACKFANAPDLAGSREDPGWTTFLQCDDGVGKRTAEVGKYAASTFGLYDMSGNAWEWIDDCYAPTYSAQPVDGSAYQPAGCRLRTIRGGSWSDLPTPLRSADREPVPSTGHGPSVGFRVARTAP